MPTPPEPYRRRLLVILSIVFGALMVWMGFRSVAEIIELNDFEVFYHAGTLASAHDPGLYETLSPVKQRPLLYPPSAAILFMPLSWMEYETCAVVFSVLKIACLVLLYWGAVCFSGAAPGDAAGRVGAMLLMAVVLFRFVNSDLGNGQVNLVVGAAAVGGIWLMMMTRRGWSLGSVLLAAAIAVKLTPALLLAVPLLYRKWAALVSTLVAAAVLMFALPVWWFGSDQFPAMASKHREYVHDFTFRYPSLHHQVTFYELYQFSRYQIHGEAVALPANDPVNDLPTAKYRDVTMPPAVAMWFTVGLLIGGVFLIARRRLFGSRPGDWTWDLAVLCAMIVLLSPRVHKAHLVMLIIPFGWMLARVIRRGVSAGGKALWSFHRGRMTALIVLTTLLLVSDDLPVPIPGVFDEPYHPGLFAALLLMIGLLWVMARHPLDGSDRAQDA